MKKLLTRLLAIAALLFTEPAFAASSIDPTVPAQNAPLSSLPIRSNFLRAKTDIDAILGMYPGASAPASPSVGQFWRNTSTNPQDIRQWDGTQWVLWAQLNTTTHIVTFPGSSLAVDANFAFNGSGQLALANAASGSVIANCGASPAEPAACTGSTWFDRLFGSTTAATVYRSTTGWSAIAPGLARPVSIAEFGAIPNDTAQATVNTAAFLAAWAVSPEVNCPAGQTYTVNSIVVPTTAKRLFGGCTLLPASTMTQGNGVLQVTSNTAGFTAENITITANVQIRVTTCTTTNASTTLSSCASTVNVTAGMVVNAPGVPSATTVVSTTANTIVLSVAAACSGTNQPACGAVSTTVSQPFDAVQAATSTRIVLRNMTLSGRYCANMINSADTLVLNNLCSSYLARGFYNLNTSGIISALYLGNHAKGGLVGSAHAFTGEGGVSTRFIGNTCEDAQVFCFSVSGLFTAMTGWTVAGNVAINALHECINAEAASGGTISNNVCTFNANSTDYGISVFASSTFAVRNIIINGNELTAPGSTGIVLSAQGTGIVTDVQVTANQVKDPNAQNKDATGACILISGVGSTFNNAYGNTCRDTVGNMKWQGLEANVGGNPNNNTLGPNYGPAGTLGFSLTLGTVSKGLLVGPFYGTFGRIANQAYTASAATKVLITNALFNTGLTFDGVTNNRITVPVSGVYRVTVQIYLLSTTAGALVDVFVQRNSVATMECPKTSGATNSDSAGCSRMMFLTGGDFLEMFFSSSVNQTIVGTLAGTWIEVQYLGP